MMIKELLETILLAVFGSSKSFRGPQFILKFKTLYLLCIKKGEKEIKFIDDQNSVNGNRAIYE
jgi:hypothetical protein